MKAKILKGCPLMALAVLVVALGLSTLTAFAGGGALVVNAADDVDDGLCDDNHCSLREALNRINADPSVIAITFDIPGTGPHVIQLCTPLPPITASGAILDATTEPDYAGAPVVMLTPQFDSGSTDSGSCDAGISIGFAVEAPYVLIRGFSLVGFEAIFPQAGDAISIGPNASAVTIEANYLGLEPSGAPHGNYRGLDTLATGDIIRGNVVSANKIGIHLTGPSHTLVGNRVGTSPDGTASGTGLGNEIGIQVDATSPGNTIGGAASDKMNLISGNSDAGLELHSSGNLVFGNRIGTNLAGSAALPNGVGILLIGDANHIGAAGPGGGNLISANQVDGVRVNSEGNFIQGNAIGTNLAGNAAIPNGVGVFLAGGDNIVGGAASGEGNLISGNEHGLYIQGSLNTIQGNYIGTDLSGGQPLPNAHGVEIEGGWGNLVGGSTAGAGNLIAFQQFEALMVSGESNTIRGNEIHDDLWGIHTHPQLGGYALRNTFSRNSIYGHVGPGIDLEGDGLTPNDPGDGDEGDNHLLNFPLLLQATSQYVQGRACPGCTVELFIAHLNPFGREGRSFLGTALTDLNGNWIIAVNNPFFQCRHLTATATDSLGNTSEFSEVLTAGLCSYLTLPHWWIAALVLTVIGGLGGATLGRRPKGPAAGAARGALLGLGAAGALLVLGIVLLRVFWRSPQPASGQAGSPPERLPPCSAWLNPQSYAPAEEEVVEDAADLILSWEIGEGAPPSAVWRVQAFAKGQELPEQAAQGSQLPFKAFGFAPVPGGRVYWRVRAAAGDGGATALGEALCEPGAYRSFTFAGLESAGPTPGSGPAPTEAVCGGEVLVTALQNLNCRQGTSQAFKIVGTLFEGDTVALQAVNPAQTWGYIANPQLNGSCWVWLGQAQVTEGDLSCAPLRADPPEPTATPLACRRDLSKDQCRISGGTWEESTLAAPYCDCAGGD